jgi:hypothetical protein
LRRLQKTPDFSPIFYLEVKVGTKPTDYWDIGFPLAEATVFIVIQPFADFPRLLSVVSKHQLPSASADGLRRLQKTPDFSPIFYLEVKVG